MSPPAPPLKSLAGAPPITSLIPCMTLSKGRVVRVQGDRTVQVLDADGNPLDVFEVADRLFEGYGRLYLLDLDGFLHDRPQLDFIQEIGRGQEMWVDAGPRDADGVMDVIIAGASVAVLSTGLVRQVREISKTLKLTQQVALELVSSHGRLVAADPTLRDVVPTDLAQEALGKGAQAIILSQEAPPIDWGQVSAMAGLGPTYVGGVFRPEEASRLPQSGARGGIFHLDKEFDAWTSSPS